MSAFVDGRLPFLGIVDTVAAVVAELADTEGSTPTIKDVLSAETWARESARARLAAVGGSG